MKKIAVIGAGSWGTALAVMLEQDGHDVTMWARNEKAVEDMRRTRQNKQYLPGVMLGENIDITCDAEKAIQSKEIIISAVPSRAVRETMTKFKDLFQKDVIIVNVAKGLEQDSLLRLSEVIKQCVPHCHPCVLSGPSHAEEVGRCIPTACVIATEENDIAKMIQKEFMNPNFRLYTNNDVIGVEVGAALKNIIALAAGMSDGLGFGDNTKAALMTRGMTEMSRLGIAMGGKAETFAGLSGIGDLIVTCTSMHSRNRRAGILLGKGKSLDETLAEVKMVVEGINTVQAACELAKKYHVSMPITEEINQVLFYHKNVREAVLQLMTRDGKAE
ncbi:NAD(P)H-dependent glycerol-3-phosphate dehydrogenase [Clostridium sp. MD294]|uniref:NAD(P)H-dependent glycerol-3-phosphate dehydrogenase n=1 Tax=Clostridium sp. MD294 TaxID=97138 RepID=UPI0002CBC650|nr:NAD(P)H-dependent glycerol-3-phosphate dehydrogenase [Clostridium sp. MD294]NDO47488.1 NAD(P)H-dependent glycerol-3-phosphate dehydrogenase [Clostridium sp. MD294]USF29440.1 Glycerol-3-phosphate dehydrogenase [NAD(P)+] [Clostridium sp. MD294]